MSRCADCVHFKGPLLPIEDWERDYDREHPERRPRAEWGSCGMTDNGFDAASDSRDTLAIAVDGSSYSAILMVDPEFGCVQFAPRASGSPEPAREEN